MKYLLEIGTEEMPAGFLPPAIEDLKQKTIVKLKEERISFGQVNTYATPRRLTLIISDIAEKQEDLSEMVKGPSVKIAFDAEGNPTKAGIGFCHTRNIDIKKSIIQDGYIFARLKSEGVATSIILESILKDLVLSLYFPKTMRWGGYSTRFVRPIKWIVSLLDDKIISFSIENVTASNTTNGHRFLGNDNIFLNNVNDYFEKLKENYVIVDAAKRKAMINEQIKEELSSYDADVIEDEELLDEISYIIEYPQVFVGNFDEKYLKLPQDVITTSMVEHQRYFPVIKDGKLLPNFIAVRNGVKHSIEIVRKGNEKVLEARLSDSEFFYEEDRKLDLDACVEKLKSIIYQEKLGSVYDKVERFKKLAKEIAYLLNVSKEQEAQVTRLAHLSKFDLVTNMVYEFPELQGVIGEEYAKLKGFDPIISKGINEHYMPRNSSDDLPSDIVGMIVSIADKLDSIVGNFAIGLIPTGSQDPYALRRSAQGICAIIMEKELQVSLKQLIDISASTFGFLNITEELKATIYDFFGPRIKTLMSDYQSDVIDCVLSTGYDDMFDIKKRANAVKEMKNEEGFESLYQAYKRVNNIVKKKTSDFFDESILTIDAEKNLYQKVLMAKKEVNKGVLAKDYLYCLKQLKIVGSDLDDFFNEVMVMVDDEKLKSTRLNLLAMVVELVEKYWNLSKLL